MDKDIVFKLLEMALANDTKEVITGKPSEERIKIAVLQRGWVVIGRAKQVEEKVYMRDTHVIRKWGTSNGLGELALTGQKSNTILDKTGDIEFDVLTSCFLIDCNQDIWETEL